MPEPRSINPVGQSQAERQLEALNRQVFGNTAQKLEEDFWNNLAAAGVSVEAGAATSDEFTEDAPVGSGPRPPSRYEKAIAEISNLRDDLVGACVGVGGGPGAEAIKKAIHRIEQVVRSLGGDIEPVDELAYMSGLTKAAANDAQAVLANADRVVENTKANYAGQYKIGKTVTKIINGSPAILIRVEGEDNGHPFNAFGQIIAEETDFSGNESIDFVRRNGNQKFFVRAVQLGTWKDVSYNFGISMAAETPRPKTAVPPLPQQPQQPQQATANDLILPSHMAPQVPPV